jgi:hypothetical protein
MIVLIVIGAAVALLLLVGFVADRRDKRRGRPVRSGRQIAHARRADRRDARGTTTQTAGMERSWTEGQRRSRRR